MIFIIYIIQINCDIILKKRSSVLKFYYTKKTILLKDLKFCWIQTWK